MLEIRNFSKSYSKGKNVVEDISLKVNNGEIYENITLKLSCCIKYKDNKEIMLYSII